MTWAARRSGPGAGPAWSEAPRENHKPDAKTPGRADRGHRLHRPISAARSCRSAVTACVFCCEVRPICRKAGQRRDRRPYAALQHGGGARRRRRRDPHRRPRQHDDGRAGRRLPPVQHRGDGRLRQGGAARAHQALRLSLLDQGAIGPNLRGRADRGPRGRAPPTPMAAPSSPPSRVSPRPISTGWPFGLPSSTAPASKATWRS